MDGNVAPLDKIMERQRNTMPLVMVDESHSAGVVGQTEKV
jgi:glycine C-acetyltransferase